MDILWDGLTVSLIGMVVVFAGLYILVGLIHLISRVSGFMDRRKAAREGKA